MAPKDQLLTQARVKDDGAVLVSAVSRILADRNLAEVMKADGDAVAEDVARILDDTDVATLGSAGDEAMHAQIAKVYGRDTPDVAAIQRKVKAGGARP